MNTRPDTRPRRHYQPAPTGTPRCGRPGGSSDVLTTAVRELVTCGNCRRLLADDERDAHRNIRDDLAAVLGPGNDDAIAYAQADSVLEVIADYYNASALARFAISRRRRS